MEILQINIFCFGTILNLILASKPKNICKKLSDWITQEEEFLQQLIVFIL